jgi:hypothetical protein
MGRALKWTLAQKCPPVLNILRTLAQKASAFVVHLHVYFDAVWPKQIDT